MKITKYEHACLDISTNNQRLVIDPGVFSTSIKDYSNISTLVITHIHGDHFDPEKVKAMVAKNPSVQIYTTQEAANQLNSVKVTIPEINKPYVTGSFALEFFGEKHAEIDPKTPLVQNIAVLVNNRLFYPGDSFTECPKPFHTLAVPTSAPWLKVGETLPLFENSQCKQVFATHDALLSESGYSVTNNWLEQFAKRNNKTFIFLQSGKSIEI